MDNTTSLLSTAKAGVNITVFDRNRCQQILWKSKNKGQFAYWRKQLRQAIADEAEALINAQRVNLNVPEVAAEYARQALVHFDALNFLDAAEWDEVEHQEELQIAQ